MRNLFIACVLVLGAGCQGLLDPGAASPGGGLACDPVVEGTRGGTIPGLRRLSRVELEGTLGALLGPEVYASDGIASRVEGLPSDRTVVAGDFSTATPGSLPIVLFQIARRVSETALTDSGWRAEHLSPCASAIPVGDACAREVAQSFGDRVYRRPLGAGEVDDLVRLYVESGAGEAGLASMVRRLLQSPSLVFHIEAGTGESVAGRLRLTEYEVASRVAYTTTDSMPDPALMDAARDGTLSDPTVLRAHAERLLDSPAGRAKVRDFARYYARLDTIPDPPQRFGTFHGLESTTGLGAEMEQEAFEFFDAVVFEREGSFSDLMLSPMAFPRSPALAQILGTAMVEGGVPVESSTHIGLLHRPALLVSSGARTSPIVRGAHVRKLFLCTTLSPPMIAAVTDAQALLASTADHPNREAVTTVTSPAPCAYCHSQINPLGFSFEGFDQVGFPRTVETILDEGGSVVRTFPIDTRVASPAVGASGPSALADSHELSIAMAESVEARACFTQRLLEYYRPSAFDRVGASCTLAEVVALGREASIRDMILGVIANEDILWREDAP